jgi:hypothetical protein
MIRRKECTMHIDEQKKFDTRNIERNIKSGIISQKDYETHLSKLPDVSDKVFNFEELVEDSKELESKKESDSQSKKREPKKRAKGKGK